MLWILLSQAEYDSHVDCQRRRAALVKSHWEYFDLP